MKAGENMPLEAIKLITDAEKLSVEKKASAEIKAKTIIADAKKQGQKIIEESRKKADEQSRQYMLKAEENGHLKSKEIAVAIQKECESLKTSASTRLEEAASLIVERIVSA